MRFALPADLQNLSWREPMTWPLRLRTTAIGAAFLLTVMLSLLLLLLPTWQNQRDQQEQERMLRDDLQRQQLRLTSLQAQSGQREGLRQAHAQAAQTMGDDDELLLLDDLGRLRQLHQLRDEGYEPLAESQLPCCRVSNSRLVLVGSYHALAHWLSDLAQLPQLLLVDDLHWQRLDAPEASAAPLRLSLVMHRYRFNAPLPETTP